MTKAARRQRSENTPDLYDGTATQRIPFEVTEGSERFETAHVIKPYTDARFLEYVDSVEGDLEDLKALEAEIQGAERAVWRDLVEKVENTESDGEFRDLIPENEIDAVMLALTRVIVVKPQSAAGGVRKLGATVNVRTQAIFNGKLLEQTHELRRLTDELRKKYDAIFAGEELKRSEIAKRKQALYKQILVKSEGFKGAVPIRFAIAVVDDHFGGVRIDPKK